MKKNTSKLLDVIFENLIWLLVAVGLIVFSSLSSSFRSPNNLASLLYRSAALGLLVLGQSFTMITGNFDLSSESGLGLTAMVAALALASADNGGLGWEVSPLVAIVLMIGVGLIIGLINGLLITRLKMNNLIVTIAMQMILRGLVYIISPGSTASFLPKAFNWLGGGTLFKIPLEKGFFSFPVATLFVIIVFVIAHIITRYTQFGRNMYAVGSNLTAAKDAGIDTDRIVRVVYLIDGFCMALAGLLAAGRIDSATPRTGAGLTFPVQAAAVIGGISMAGGRGNMIGALGGLLLWSILDNGLSIIRVSPFWIETSRGLILLFAVWLDAVKVKQMHNRSLIDILLQSTIGLKDKTIVKN